MIFAIPILFYSILVNVPQGFATQTKNTTKKSLPPSPPSTTTTTPTTTTTTTKIQPPTITILNADDAPFKQSSISSRNQCANDTDIIDHILYDTTVNYNRHKIPADPVTVRIEMWIQEVTSVSEMTQDFEIGKKKKRREIHPKSGIWECL